MIMGMSWFSARIAFMTSRPVFPGIFQSVITTSKLSGSALNTITASSPVATSVMLSTPIACRDWMMIFRIVLESSAKRTRMVFFLCERAICFNIRFDVWVIRISKLGFCQGWCDVKKNP